MNNVTLLCLFGMFVLFVVLVLPRFMNSGNNNQSTDGGERPQHDDPRIEGRGSFGRPQEDTRKGTPDRQPNRRVDDKNISGRGSFGRDKDD
jgi:hypothetical protein